MLFYARDSTQLLLFLDMCEYKHLSDMSVSVSLSVSVNGYFGHSDCARSCNSQHYAIGMNVNIMNLK